MQILLIEGQPPAIQTIVTLARQKYAAEWIEAPTLQQGIELLEVNSAKPDLVICDYPGKSLALLKCLLAVSSKIPCILLTDAAISPELFIVPREAMLETLARAEMPAALKKLLEQLHRDGLFLEASTVDSDFVRVNTRTLVLSKPLRADIYLRLAPGRYCKRFQKGDSFDSDDLETHFRAKGIDAFYLHREQTSVLFEHQNQALDAIAGNPGATEKEARQAAAACMEIVQDVVDQLGFTPQVQELVKKTVTLMLKAIGSSPKLSGILTRLRAHEGKYITSHSVMLAEVSCAIAYRVGWNTASIFLKLSLASFLHDLPMKSNQLARFKTLADLEGAPGFSPDEVSSFKFHPLKAAEYSRQISGIPPDVDTMLLQHHELPDGSGFPRGLHHHQIATMACVFIVAHDLLHFFLDRIPTNDRMDMLRIFLKENHSKYGEGHFRKICSSLETGVPISLVES